MTTGVIAVVSHYWPSRRKFLPEIISAFQGNTVVPDDIVVWNNHPDPLAPIEGVTVINSSRNLRARAKWVAALTTPSPYYILNDDDIAPRRRTIEHYLDYASSGCCISTQGIIMTTKSLYDGKEVNGLDIDSPVRVHAFNGMQQFVSIEAIGNMFVAEGAIGQDGVEFGYAGDDIIIAMANEVAMVIPMDGDDWGYISLEGAQQESMNSEIGYYTVRNMLAWRYWQHFKDKPLPGRFPTNAQDRRRIEGYRQLIAGRA